MATKTTTNAVATTAASPVSLTRSREWMRLSPIFVTLINIFIMTTALFVVVMVNSVLLAREESTTETYASLAIVCLAVSSVMILNIFLHLFYGRFDTENRTQRHWIAGTALLLAVGILIHNVFWFINAHYSPSTFPSPDYSSYSAVGFVFCFFMAIHGWYQLKFANRLYI